MAVGELDTLGAGDVLESYYYIGDRLFGYLIVDPTLPDISTLKSFRADGGVYCPICEGENDTVVWLYCQHHQQSCYCHYCPDCWLAWETILVGEGGDGK